MKDEKEIEILGIPRGKFIIYIIGLVLCGGLTGIYFINIKSTVLSICCSLGTGGISAIILAYFIDLTTMNAEKRKLKREKEECYDYIYSIAYDLLSPYYLFPYDKTEKESEVIAYLSNLGCLSEEEKNKLLPQFIEYFSEKDLKDFHLTLAIFESVKYTRNLSYIDGFIYHLLYECIEKMERVCELIKATHREWSLIFDEYCEIYEYWAEYISQDSNFVWFRELLIIYDSNCEAMIFTKNQLKDKSEVAEQLRRHGFWVEE